MEEIQKAAIAIRNSTHILISAGAGMGVDSGLPDFRGNHGFWKAYPAIKDLGLSFTEVSDPQSFLTNPKFGWAFFGHRYQLYSSTVPHNGFNILKEWCKSKKDYFVYTSNVDGQFQKAGFEEDHIYEMYRIIYIIYRHGSIHYLQCIQPCTDLIWPSSGLLDNLQINDKFSAEGELPKCKNCGGLARPNILMFNDYYWISKRSDEQEDRYNKFIGKIEKLAVIEIGCGTAVPTVRVNTNYLSRGKNVSCIRINPTDQDKNKKIIQIREGGLSGITKINEILKSLP